ACLAQAIPGNAPLILRRRSANENGENCFRQIEQSLAAIIADFCNKQPNPSHSRQIRESPCHDPNEPTCVAIMPQLFRPRPLSGGAKRPSVSNDAYDRGPMESVALDIGCLPNLAFKRVPAAGSRNECGIALSQFVITQPAVIFFSAAYFDAASLTMGAIME